MRVQQNYLLTVIIQLKKHVIIQDKGEYTFAGTP